MTKKIIYAVIIILVVAIIGGYIGAKLVGGNKSTGVLGATPTGETNFSALGLGPQDLPLVEMVSSGALTTATATIAYEANPFGATTTVDFAEINVTSAPSASVAAITYTCGTTTVPGAAPSATLITSGATATSTTVFLVNEVIGGPGNSVSAGNTRITVNSNEYVACYITTASSTAANAGIAGTYKFRWVR